MAVSPEDKPTIEGLATELRTRARVPFSEVAFLPKQPGLYAIWAETPEAKFLLGLSDAGFSLPLYVGLARQPLPGRVGQYVDPSDDHYVPARHWIEFQLLVASQVTVPEAILFQTDLLWLDPPLPLHGEHLDSLTAWMRDNLSVSVVAMDSKREAQRLEHSVIRDLEPVINQKGMEWSLDIPDYIARRYAPEAEERRLVWIRAFTALQLLWEIFAPLNRREAIEASERTMYLSFDDIDMPDKIVPARGDHTAAVPLTLPLHPDARAEACQVAMDHWYGEPYPDVDRMLRALGNADWMPGALFYLLGSTGESFLSPLVQLTEA